MVFNRSGRLLKESHGFYYGNELIKPAREYCYLGIVFPISGSLLTAQHKLRQKGIRSYFALKRLIDIRDLKKSTIFKLFDSLILPIASYGCSVWLPQTWFFRCFTEGTTSKKLQAIAKDPLEQLHLSFMKWTMGVHKKTSNAPIWGDCGRFPLAVQLSKQVFNYIKRRKSMNDSNSNCLVRHAFCEQVSLNLPWFRRIHALHEKIAARVPYQTPYPSQLRKELAIMFEETWNQERISNKKLDFYNKIKNKIETETYLNMDVNSTEGKRLAQFRTSSHRYNIEAGRYGTNKDSKISRICHHCCTNDEQTLKLLEQLPCFDPPLEDEFHILLSCPKYDHPRNKLKQETKIALQETSKIHYLFQNLSSVREIAKFLTKCHNIRFPIAKKVKKVNRSTQTD